MAFYIYFSYKNCMTVITGYDGIQWQKERIITMLQLQRNSPVPNDN